MPAWALTILGSIGAVAVKMLTQLLTEAFLKKAAIVALEKIAAKTETDADNQLVEAAKEAWK